MNKNIRDFMAELGFKETRNNFFVKKIDENITIYYDRRNNIKNLFAYNKHKTIDHNKLKESNAIDKIEEYLINNDNTLKRF